MDQPPLSEDGHWWWDGSKWQPISTHPDPARRPQLRGAGTGGATGSADASQAKAQATAARAAPKATPVSGGGGRGDIPSWLPPESAKVVSEALARYPQGAPTSRANGKGGTRFGLPRPGSRPRLPSMPGLKGRPLAIGAAAVLVIVIGYLALSQVSNLHLNLGPNFSSGASAADLLNSGIDSLSSGHSYHLAVTGSGGSLDVSVQELGLAQVTLKDSTGDVSMIVSDGREYLKAPASFYNPRNPIIGQHAANQWVMLAQAETLQVFDDVTNLAGIAQCTLGRHGSLTYAGSTSVDGESVQEVDDRGDGPSGARARFYFGSDKRVVAMDLTEPVLPSPSPPADSQSSNGSSSALQCAGGTGVYDTGFRGNQHYHFDRWGGTFDIAAPKGAIDLESAPWCGTMAARELSTAAQQFLAAQYDLDQKLKTITQEPGCCDPHNWSQFSQALKDEATARDAEGQAISKLPGLDGQTKSDADALAQAIAATVKQLKQSASGTAGTWQSTGANQRSDLGTVESGDVDALRQDLNLPSGTCSFAVP